MAPPHQERPAKVAEGSADVMFCPPLQKAKALLVTVSRPCRPSFSFLDFFFSDASASRFPDAS